MGVYWVRVSYLSEAGIFSLAWRIHTSFSQRREETESVQPLQFTFFKFPSYVFPVSERVNPNSVINNPGHMTDVVCLVCSVGGGMQGI